MTRAVLLLATFLAGIPAVVGFTSGHSTYAAGNVDELVLTIDVPGGQPIEAQFIVSAGSDQDALATALNAALQLVPGGTVYPPEAAKTSGDGRVTAAWAPWGWTWDATELPVPVLYNPAGAPAGVGPAEVRAALATWTAVPASSFAFDYAGETDTTTSMDVSGPDGLNVIAWKNLECSPGCVLGVTTRSFTSHEGDIVLNSNPRANLGDGSGDTVDSFSVVLHESGHLLGLEHSCPIFGPCSDAERAAVMFYAYGGERRGLQPDDIAGLETLYPAGDAANAVGESYPAVSIALVEGWNLVTLPGGSIDPLVEGLSCVDAVYSLGGAGWSRWIRGAPAQIQTLGVAAPGSAVWVHATGACGASIVP